MINQRSAHIYKVEGPDLCPCASPQAAGAALYRGLSLVSVRRIARVLFVVLCCDQEARLDDEAFVEVVFLEELLHRVSAEQGCALLHALLVLVFPL